MKFSVSFTILPILSFVYGKKSSHFVHINCYKNPFFGRKSIDFGNFDKFNCNNNYNGFLHNSQIGYFSFYGINGNPEYLLSFTVSDNFYLLKLIF